jgi:hypothetical protein
MSRIAAVVMHAPLGDSPGETLVEKARAASTIDLVTTLRVSGVETIVLVAADASLTDALGKCGVPTILTTATAPFHFGRVLQQAVAGHSIDGLLYFGSGSGGLLDETGMRTLVRFAMRRDCGALFNNFYSCDFCAVADAQKLLSIELPSIDNPLGLTLADAGIPCFSLPRDAKTQFDIDTPTDVLLLAAAERGGTRTKELLRTLSYRIPNVARLMELLRIRSARLKIVGRVNPMTWAYFERAVACRTSVISEGRGLRAYPDGSGTLLGGFLKEKGTVPFLSRLEETADGAIIDSRPLLADEGPIPAPSDRFASDLLMDSLIDDPKWRDFTLAAKQAKIPVVLGGHSLVNGGLYLLADSCWKDHDLPRRLHPDTIGWEKE